MSLLEPTIDATRTIGAEVKLTPNAAGGGLPVFITPVDPRLASDLGHAVAWLRERQAALDDYLCEVGAVVLRGFAFRDTHGFGAAIDHYPDMPHGYTGGASPRSAIEGRVFEATRAPAEAKLMFHQEMAYLPNYPSKLAFFCNVPATTGGATLIADVRRFDEAVDPKFRAQIKQRGVRYTRNFRSPDWSSGDVGLDTFHRPWTEAFGTTDKGKVEADCRAMGLECEWAANDSCSVIYTAAGFVTHPRTGREVWFNHIPSQTPNVTNRGSDRGAMYDKHYGPGVPRPYHTTYGDGTDFDPEDVMALYPILDRLEVDYAYEQGDLMLLDNFYVFHGRSAYTGPRDVQVALLG